MDQIFIKKACDILGDTDNGLSTTQIIEILGVYAYKYGKNIPITSIESMREQSIPNKRTALYKNMLSFNEEEQYRIIRDLCDEPKLKDDVNVKELKSKLFLQYGKMYDNKEKILVSSKEISEHWLDKYPRAYKVYKEAMIKYSNKIFNRNILDDLRLSLELLVKDILKNEQSLENQNKELSVFLLENSNSQQIINLFNTLLKSYETYHNNIVKHYKESNSAENIKENELDFIVELTNIVIKFLIENDKVVGV